MNENMKKRIKGYKTIFSIFKSSKNIEKIDKAKINKPLDNINFDMISISESIETMVKPLKDISESIQAMVKPFIEVSEKIGEIVKPLVDAFTNLNFEVSPYFLEISETFKKASENPDSFLNWYEYYKKLGEYFWTFPFEMKSEELKYILQNVNSEKEFDKYMLKYFSKEKIINLERYILKNIPRKHQTMFKQIINSFHNKNYAIANLGITAIIDDLCTYFLEDKGCNSREDLFLPIIEKVEESTADVFEVIPLLIINANINVLYESIDFRKRIILSTHKTARRNPGQHGKKFSNKKLDTIMLLNTIYYMLIVIENFGKYKDKVICVRNKKDFERADFQGDYNKDRKFYIKKRYFRKNQK